MTLPRLALLALLLSLCGGAWGQTSWHTLTTDANLLGRWASIGSDNANDSSGNGNNGTWTGTAAYTDGPITIGKAFNLNGSSYISAGNVAPFPNSTDFSAAFFVRETSFSTGPRYMFAQSNAFEAGWGVRNGDGSVDSGVGLLGYAGNVAGLGATVGTRTTSQWHAVVMTYVGSTRTLTLWLDGTKIHTESGVTEVTGGTVLTIGSRNGMLPHVGQIYDARVYSRVLTDDEIDEYSELAEPQYTSGATLESDGALNVGTWDDYSNGDATYEWVVANAAGTVIDSGTGDTGTATGLTPGTFYLYVRASNDGGYDIGDHGEREGAYGEANDGYYEVASVEVLPPKKVMILRSAAYHWHRPHAMREEELQLAA